MNTTKVHANGKTVEIELTEKEQEIIEFGREIVTRYGLGYSDDVHNALMGAGYRLGSEQRKLDVLKAIEKIREAFVDDDELFGDSFDEHINAALDALKKEVEKS